jgi:hypothetical protein
MDVRTIVLGAGVFCATFLVGWWLNIGNLVAGISLARPATVGQATAPQADPSASHPVPATATQKVAVRTPQSKAPLQPKSWNGPGLVRDKLMRDALISWAENYQRPRCNQDVRWGYTQAATRYAEALMRAAGCNNFPRCPMSMSQLERVWEANRSALDRPVALAMADAHAAGGLSEKSFRGDVGRAVRVIAARDFATGPAPECSNRSSRTWSIRIRRR